MNAKEAATTLADQLGASLVCGRGVDGYEITAEAPIGHHWADGHVHEFIASSWTDDETGKNTPARELWVDILERMKGGVEMCNSACEYWS